MTPTLTRRDETIRAEKNSHTTTATVGIVGEDLGRGIIQLQEAIWWGNFKIHVLEADWVQPRKKSMILDEGINKLEIEVTQAYYAEKLSMMG